MLSKIADLEKILNDLLPPRRLDKRPSKELLDAELIWSQTVWKEAECLGAFTLEEEHVENAIRLSKHPVFICGVHRSGTTLVRDLLDGHPSLTVLPAEGSYFTNVAPKLKKMHVKEREAFMGTEWLRRLANPINQPPYWLLGRSSPAESPYIMFARLYKAWWALEDERLNKTFHPLLAAILAYASVNGEIMAKQWVDKTPANEQFLKKIWREMPEARIIHVIRNPVDIFISRKRMEPWLNMRTFLRVLQKSFKVAYERSSRNDGRYLLLRYEELCKNPDTVIKRLAEFLEIEPTPGLFTPTVNGKPSSANSSFEQVSHAGHILAADEHKPDGQLSDHEYELLSAYAGKLSGKLGYPIKPINPWRSLLLKMKYLLP